MTSSKTQLPYEYYNLPIHCKPSTPIKYKSENLGEILRGDRIVNTGFVVRMLQNDQCLIACQDIELNEDQTKQINKRIKDAYHVHLLDLEFFKFFYHSQWLMLIFRHVSFVPVTNIEFASANNRTLYVNYSTSPYSQL